MSSEFAQAVSEEQKNVVLKKYAEQQAQGEEAAGLARSLAAEKSQHQRLLLEAQHTILKLSDTNERLTARVKPLESQVASLQAKLSSDHLASSSLQSILEGR